ncbi:SGNH/GDSL hydrolase family protein [Coleofasciculus sp. G2-EDA-02]|uniref:SGNH/GDSL hydrolase family protein n=1 Tax=Coleofasciculus sp. G2-EDA-02 TaxID=3069529 RepID=UPI0032F1133A
MQKRQRLFRFTFLLILVALVLSLIINIFLFSQAKSYYLQLNKTNLDPFGLQTFNNDSLPDSSLTTSPVTVVFFGDSRAAMWVSPPKLNGFSFINRGIGNQTSTQVLGRFEQHILPLNTDIIVVQVGINDLKAIPLFPHKKATIISNCKANIQQIVARSLNLDATVILTTIFPIGPVPLIRKPFWSPDVAQAVKEVNAYLYSLKAKNVLILDAYSLLGENQQVQSKYVYDTLHINRRGYKALNQELTKMLSTWLIDNSINNS